MARAVARPAAAAPRQWIAPQLTQLVDAAPEGDAWLHEIKFDPPARRFCRLNSGRQSLCNGVNFPEAPGRDRDDGLGDEEWRIPRGGPELGGRRPMSTFLCRQNVERAEWNKLLGPGVS
jgi:hypothetical protein